jgi:hypothetical protein
LPAAAADNAKTNHPEHGGAVGEPERYDPEQKPDPKAPRPSIQKADWVVGAEDGLSAELERSTSGDSAITEAPKLVRPADPDADKPREPGRYGASGVFRRPLPEGIASPTAAPTPSMPSWEKGASSIPRLRTVESDAMASTKTTKPAPSPAAPAAPPSGRDFPMDDAEERARYAAEAAAQQREEAAILSRPHQVVAPQEFDLPTVAPAWWTTAADQLRSDRRVQAGIVLALAAALTFMFWPRGEKTTSIAHLKEHPESYADTPVRVGGRVSEVFAVGGSWAYTVVQGRDTIVVFSRTREPKVRERIEVVGTLSRGYLDGQSRVAIFESMR